jgi:hypothetical protein
MWHSVLRPYGDVVEDSGKLLDFVGAVVLLRGCASGGAHGD